MNADTNLRHGLTQNASWRPHQFNLPYDRLLRNSDSTHLANPYDSPSRGERWAQTTEVRLGIGWDQRTLSYSFFPVLAELETHRRGLWLMLALQAYRQQHGRLPDRLEELVGPFLDRLPADPVNGLAFEYRPQGIPIPFEVGSDGAFIPPQTPLLSSPSSMSARFEPVTTDYWNRVGHNPSDEVPSNKDVRWMSVVANGIRYGEALAEPVYNSGAKFSLKSSF